MKIEQLETDWTFAKDDPRPGRHKLHGYPATMIAPCVQKILDIANPKSVFDPFSGSGTVMWECLKRGVSFHGNDLNPLSLLIMRAKIQNNHDKVLPLLNLLEKLKEQSLEIIQKAKTITVEKTKLSEQDNILKDIYEDKLNKKFPMFKNISYWFLPEVILSLQLIKEALPQDDFIKMCFSECVRIVSNRRAGEFKLFRRSEEELERYSPAVFNQFIKIINKNLSIVKSDTYEENIIPVLHQLDARNLDGIPNNEFDCTITSPPYGDSRTTVAYGQFSRLSLQWLDYSEPNVDNKLLGGSKPSKHNLFGTIEKLLNNSEIKPKRVKEVKGFFSDLQEAFASISSKIKSGGHSFWVVGNRLISGIRMPLDIFIKEIGEANNHKHVATLQRRIPYKSMPKQNSPTNQSGVLAETMSEESIVVLTKN